VVGRLARAPLVVGRLARAPLVVDRLAWARAWCLTRPCAPYGLAVPVGVRDVCDADVSPMCNSAKIMRRGSRRRHEQLNFEHARKPDGQHGGWRPGAGRPRKPGAVSHAARPDEPGRYPQHVTLRVKEGVPSLARERLIKIIRAVVRDAHKDASGVALASVRRKRGRSAAAGARAQDGGFRIVEFNVLGNHLHLIVEAAGKESLSRGVQGFCVSAARRLNPALMRTGKLFAHRYHSRPLHTPREVRNALAYVLLNRKHHNAGAKFDRYWVDPFSSAAWFTGWAEPISRHAWTVAHLVGTSPPTKPPSVWLLTTGWKQHGLLRFDERPA